MGHNPPSRPSFRDAGRRAEVLSINGSVAAHGGQALRYHSQSFRGCHLATQFMRAAPRLQRRTIMNRRTLTTMALLGLAVATALPQIGFAQSNPWIGTWKADLAKSTFSPGPPPRSMTVTFQAEGQGLRLTFDIIDAQRCAGQSSEGGFYALRRWQVLPRSWCARLRRILLQANQQLQL